tara:strand:+ start:6867 stop:7151 length:285 start_codon:yes stop_codon:yes gene_type:complete
MAALTEEERRWSETSNQLGNVVKFIDSEKSNTVDLLDPNPKAIWFQNGGSLKVLTMGGTTIEIASLPSDFKIDWLRIKRVYATGTSVSNITAIY